MNTELTDSFSAFLRVIVHFVISNIKIFADLRLEITGILLCKTASHLLLGEKCDIKRKNMIVYSEKRKERQKNSISFDKIL